MIGLIIFFLIILGLMVLYFNSKSNKELKELRRKYDEKDEPITIIGGETSGNRKVVDSSSVGERVVETIKDHGGHPDVSDSSTINSGEDKPKPRKPKSRNPTEVVENDNLEL